MALKSIPPGKPAASNQLYCTLPLMMSHAPDKGSALACSRMEGLLPFPGISACGDTMQGYGTEQIDRLVTLGSPHQAPPKASFATTATISLYAPVDCKGRPYIPVMLFRQGLEASFSGPFTGRTDEGDSSQPCVVQDLKLVDQTRGILTWVTDNVPGNFHKEVGYATVCSCVRNCSGPTLRTITWLILP